MRARQDAEARRLTSVPGIGPITAMAIQAFAPPMVGFRRGRDFPAWLGLVPRQHSTGGKPRLGRITKTGDYSDVVVVDAEGQRLPWPEISRFDEDEMRDLMRQIVNKIYTFLAKMDDPDFAAWRDFLQPQTEYWDKPRLDRTLMHFVEEYARVRRKRD